MPATDSNPPRRSVVVAASRADAVDRVLQTARRSDGRYGPFTSTHEALGTLAEEWHELVEAIRDNDLDAIRGEAADLAAAALRLSEQCGAPSDAFRERSGA